MSEKDESYSNLEKGVLDDSSTTDSISVISSEEEYTFRPTLKNIAGRWASQTPIINNGLDSDIDGLFDVEELKLTRSQGSFSEEFRGTVFWLNEDSTMMVATDYVQSDEKKSHFDRYSTSHFKKSIWHYASNGKLIVEFVFNDGADEVSKIYYDLFTKDKFNIKLIKTKTEFYVEGEEF